MGDDHPDHLAFAAVPIDHTYFIAFATVRRLKQTRGG
jgi:hypothetical protein